MKRARLNDLAREDDAYATRLAEWKALLFAYYKDAAVKLAEIVGYWNRTHLYLRIEPRLELIRDDDVILYEHRGRVLCGMNGNAPYPLDMDTLWPWAVGTVNWAMVPVDVIACIAHHVDAYHKVTMAHTCRAWRRCVMTRSSLWERHATPFQWILFNDNAYMLFCQVRAIFRANTVKWYNVPERLLRIIFFAITTVNEDVRWSRFPNEYGSLSTFNCDLRVNPGNLCCNLNVPNASFVVGKATINEALRYFLFDDHVTLSHGRYLLDHVIVTRFDRWRRLIKP